MDNTYLSALLIFRCNKVSGSYYKPDYTVTINCGINEITTKQFVMGVKAPIYNKNSNGFIKINYTVNHMLDNLARKRR